ncbi:putative secreted RxLR effector protein [Phytophthora cinnamomi]|uniref:putative secreted RxLR effector protein n=1 Tax=Phytophthora cinnamomi TaxID=4785 RepID=UPI002A2F8888|nr:putative secreted RxLR effector protein [Phytophthora cinnamomi]KAJ8538873.1 hypothetical protein ON010_g13000 [Phytophthora cinnamomi]
MRFCYLALAAGVTLLAGTSAASAESQLSQMTPELVTRALADAPISGAAKRSLRSYKTYEEENSLDSLDETEERAGGAKILSVRAFQKLVKAKRYSLPLNIGELKAKQQERVVETWVKQNLNQKQVAKKLGMKGVNDKENHNFKFFEAIKSRFKEP